jgi:hypothetical protein
MNIILASVEIYKTEQTQFEQNTLLQCKFLQPSSPVSIALG